MRITAAPALALLLLAARALPAQEPGAMPSMGAQTAQVAGRPPADSLRTAEQVKSYIASVREGIASRGYGRDRISGPPYFWAALPAVGPRRRSSSGR